MPLLITRKKKQKTYLYNKMVLFQEWRKKWCNFKVLIDV